MRKEKKYHYIYKTTNNLNNRYYYGLHSSDILEDGYLGSGTYLRRSIRKYGKENFTREIVEFCKTRKELKSREREIITLQEIANKECMNLVAGGHIGFNGNHTDESKKKISDSLIGNIHKLGKKVSKETRKKMSESAMGHVGCHKGKKFSEETRKKMSVNAKNRQPMNEETKQKISNTLKGHIISESTKKKISKTKISNPYTHTKEERKKISIANSNPTDEVRKRKSAAAKGRKFSDETKEKIRNSMKLYHKKRKENE